MVRPLLAFWAFIATAFAMAWLLGTVTAHGLSFAAQCAAVAVKC